MQGCIQLLLLLLCLHLCLKSVHRRLVLPGMPPGQLCLADRVIVLLMDQGGGGIVLLNSGEVLHHAPLCSLEERVQGLGLSFQPIGRPSHRVRYQGPP